MKKTKVIILSSLSLFLLTILSFAIYVYVVSTTYVHCDVYSDRIFLYSKLNSHLRCYTIYYDDIKSIELIDKPNTKIDADTSDYDDKFNVEVGLRSRECFGLYYSMIQSSRKKAIQIIVEDNDLITNKYIFAVALFENMDSLYEEIVEMYNKSKN